MLLLSVSPGVKESKERAGRRWMHAFLARTAAGSGLMTLDNLGHRSEADLIRQQVWGSWEVWHIDAAFLSSQRLVMREIHVRCQAQREKSLAQGWRLAFPTGGKDSGATWHLRKSHTRHTHLNHRQRGELVTSVTPLASLRAENLLNTAHSTLRIVLFCPPTAKLPRLC